MTSILLTQNSTFIIGPVAKLLGFLMNGIFELLYKIGIPNVGIAIILFTVIIYLLMMPLTIKQQKFSRLSAKMNPEIQAIQKKYANKRDNESMMRMNEEIKAVQAKYGVSSAGSCLQLFITLPIMYGLYRVIYNIPAYVTKIKLVYEGLVGKLMATDATVAYIKEIGATKGFQKSDYSLSNTFIDVLYKFNDAEWTALAEKFPDIAGDITTTVHQLEEYNNFLGINILNSPSSIISEAFKTGSFVLVLGAIAIPVFGALAQWINIKLMPQPQMEGQEENPMMSSMKMMNYTMPIMSAVFCYSLPVGVGLYWIAGPLVRSVIQIITNKHLDSIDLDEEIRKNIEKAGQKKKKQSFTERALAEAAKANAKAVESSGLSQKEKEEQLRKANEYYKKASANPDSIAAKANMVRKLDEKNKK